MPLVEPAAHWECEMCGLAVGWVENDLPEGEEEVGLPSGWVRIDCRMIGQNPEIVSYRAGFDDATMKMATSFAGDGEVTKEHIDTARQLVEASQPFGAPPQHYVEIDVSFCLCHECKPYLANIEIKDFGVPPDAEPEATIAGGE
jgi:hypothetical protein